MSTEYPRKTKIRRTTQLRKTRQVAPDSSKYYCEKHAKIHNEWQIPRKEHSSAYLNKLKVEPLKQTYETAGIQSDGTKLTKKDMIERLVSHYGRICYVPAVIAPAEKKLGAGEVDLITIGRKIKQCLDSDPEIVSDNNRIQVLIENQISTIATRMKTIQGMIAQYFIIKFEQNATIEFVSSHNKLKGFVRDPESQKSGYKANKMDGIRICSEFFDKNPAGMAKWREAFDKSSKRDDLADCFLQGITRL